MTRLYRFMFPPRLEKAASCLAYAGCSIAMVLANKSSGAEAPSQSISVLPIVSQNVCCIVLLEGLRAMRVVSYDRISLETLFSSSVAVEGKAEKTKNLLLVLQLSSYFVAMVLSGFMCLKCLNVPMVTIFKNATNLLIVFGEWKLYAEPVSLGVFSALSLMVLGAGVAAANDLSFSGAGLSWALLNCSASAAYALQMRKCTQAVDLSRFGTVLLNNAVSLALLSSLAVCTGELAAAFPEDPHQKSAAAAVSLGTAGSGPAWSAMSALASSSTGRFLAQADSGFVLLNVLTGVVGFLLNFAQLWCVGSTSATTYSIVGTVNKIPIAILGRFLFKTEMTTQGYVFVAVNLFGCLLYSYFKIQEKRKQQQQQQQQQANSQQQQRALGCTAKDPMASLPSSGSLLVSATTPTTSASAAAVVSTSNGTVELRRPHHARGGNGKEDTSQSSVSWGDQSFGTGGDAAAEGLLGSTDRHSSALTHSVSAAPKDRQASVPE